MWTELNIVMQTALGGIVEEALGVVLFCALLVVVKMLAVWCATKD